MLKISDHEIAVIILAAGRGERMRHSRNPKSKIQNPKSKLLLPLGDGQPVIVHTVRNAATWEPSEIMVVTPPTQDEIASALSGLPARCVPNPRYKEGMGTSLAAGVAALGENTEAVLVLLGDMPLVPGPIIETLVGAYIREGKSITIPLYGQQVGPPTLFARQIFPELLRLEGDIGGRQIIEQFPGLACFVPFGEHERPLDIDTPEDLERANP